MRSDGEQSPGRESYDGDSTGVQGAMKSLTRSLAVCGVIALLSSISMSLLFTWVYARFISFQRPVPFSVACERMNTLASGIWLFVIVFSLGIMRAVLRELRRRAFDEVRQATTERKSDEKDSHK